MCIMMVPVDGLSLIVLLNSQQDATAQIEIQS
jgi:hypothetical protein